MADRPPRDITRRRFLALAASAAATAPRSARAAGGRLEVYGTGRVRDPIPGVTVPSPSDFGFTADAGGGYFVCSMFGPETGGFLGHRLERIAPDGRRTPFAGTGTAGSTGDGGPATAARTVAPEGITADAHGNIFFTESGFMGYGLCGTALAGSEKVRMVDPDGRIHTFVGPAGTGAAVTLNVLAPHGLHHGSDGSLFLGEAGTQRAFRIHPDGSSEQVAGRLIGPYATNSGYGGPALRARSTRTTASTATPTATS